jgi:hydrophobic/amphiphilic exporter-1 (mainly G- bacteria), HAE1 family
MNPARFSVHRPVFTTMVALIVVILGGISLSRLPVDLMPDVSYPTLSVSSTYENASPEEVEELITRPIEEAMSAVPGVEDVSSISGEGSSNVRVTFSWGTDLDAAANDIRDRLDRVIPRLPEDASRPALRKFDPAAFPILIMGAAGRLDPVALRRLIEDEVKHRIERVPGVAALDVWGGLEREIHVDVDPDKLRMLGLPMEQVVQRIRAANVTLPAGSIEEGLSEVTLRAPGEFRDLDELRDTAVSLRDGVTVRLRDVAEVSDKWQRVRRIVRVNGLPGVRVSINKQSGVNTVEVARRALAEVERINRDLPQIRMTPIIDTSEFIERSIASVRSAALYGGLFALLIVLLFLRSLRSTAIIGVAIPLSIVATFVIIYFGGFTLNLMTLGGLALGVGMLVDNSIVTLESIYRRRKAGMDAQEAAIKGAGEVSGAIVASTLTTLAVFLPLIFVRGMAGVMFRQLAYVVSFALLCSLGAALTLIPMLSSKFLRVASASAAQRDAPSAREWTARLEDGYKLILETALAHRGWVALGCVALLGGSLTLIPLVGVELMPASDEGEVRMNVEMEVGTRLTETDRVTARIESIATNEVPELRNMVASVGGSHWRAGGSHTANLRMSLAPRTERRRSSEDVAAALRPKLGRIPGATVRVRAGQGFFLMRRMTGGDERVEVEIRGYDLDESDRIAQRVLAVVEQTAGVTDAQVSREIGSPEQLVRVDRGKAESMNVSVRQVADLLQTALTGTRAGFYRDGGDEIVIRVKLKDAEQRPLREILDLALARPDGGAVALRNIVSAQSATGPALIERRNQERIVTVRANIAGRDMGSIMTDIRAALRNLPVPQGFAIVYGGDYEEQQAAFSELALGLALALVLVYMVMACLYESLRDPFIVMFSVPMAIIGVILILFLTRTTFNIQSYIGCIMLGGIVVNNAILLVDTANSLRKEEGLRLHAAVAEAGCRRLRPILMTALTTICGLLPLALGLGVGGEAQAPMARAVIGGLLSSTLVTLVFVPVVYTLFEKKDLVRTP